MRGYVEGTDQVGLERYVVEAYKQIVCMSSIGSVRPAISLLGQLINPGSRLPFANKPEFEERFGFSVAEISKVLAKGYSREAENVIKSVSPSTSGVPGENYLRVRCAYDYAAQACTMGLTDARMKLENSPEFADAKAAAATDYKKMLGQLPADMPEHIHCQATILAQLPRYTDYNVILAAVELIRNTKEPEQLLDACRSMLRVPNQVLDLEDVLNSHTGRAHRIRANELSRADGKAHSGFMADYVDALVSFHQFQSESVSPATTVDFQKVPLHVTNPEPGTLVVFVAERPTGGWAGRPAHASYAA